MRSPPTSMKNSPCSLQLESPHTATKTQHNQKILINLKNKKVAKGGELGVSIILTQSSDGMLTELTKKAFLEHPLSFLTCKMCAESCLTLCDPMDCSLPGSSVHGIFQEGILELPCPPPGDLPNPGIKPASLAFPADTLPLAHLRMGPHLMWELNERIRGET